jgi:hypothetical protein
MEDNRRAVGCRSAVRPLWRENLLYEEETGGGFMQAGRHRLEVGLKAAAPPRSIL